MLRYLIPVVVVLFTSQAAPTAAVEGDEWEQRLDRAARESAFVVLGRIADVEGWPAARGLETRATLTVTRQLKGVSDRRAMPVRVTVPAHVELRAEGEEGIWFIDNGPEAGTFVVKAWKWSVDSLRRIEDVLSRIDRTTRIPNMPASRPDREDLSAVIAVDDGSGRGLPGVTLEATTPLRLRVQLENHARHPTTVMPPLDGSRSLRRYPHYRLEVRDADGKRVDLRGLLMCGNINSFQVRDFVTLDRAEVLRARLDVNPVEFPGPGKYRFRLHYTAKRDMTKEGIAGDDEPSTPGLMKSVWEGTAVSNWIDVEILPKNR